MKKLINRKKTTKNKIKIKNIVIKVIKKNIQKKGQQIIKKT